LCRNSVARLSQRGAAVLRTRKNDNRAQTKRTYFFRKFDIDHYHDAKKGCLHDSLRFYIYMSFLSSRVVYNMIIRIITVLFIVITTIIIYTLRSLFYPVFARHYVVSSKRIAYTINHFIISIIITYVLYLSFEFEWV
jgi:hypothetical protein